MNEEFTAKQAPVEELTMPTADLNPSPVAVQAEDWGMTNAHGKPPGALKSDGDGWRMPEPIFRVSDGFCPLQPDGKSKAGEKEPPSFAARKPRSTADEPLTNLYAPPEKETETDVSQHTMHNLSLSDLSELKASVPELAPVSPPIAAAPQPNISQEFIVKEQQPQTAPEKKERGEKMRFFLAALGVSAMLAFAAGFLALVYFLFFYKAAE